ncbi:methylamine--glutamate N-methyltransferase [Salvia divinorum]|uniref:Methylamine--glutamate N-methyltransferase n=1 Tax=Salvia divinorum TaxID=28513 RepID=A0ABD1GMQ1_SALDI
MCGCGIRSLRYLAEADGDFVLDNNVNLDYGAYDSYLSMNIDCMLQKTCCMLEWGRRQVVFFRIDPHSHGHIGRDVGEEKRRKK